MNEPEKLSARISGIVTEHAPLAPYTTFRIGGVAKIFVEPRNAEDIILTKQFATENSLPLFILGNGSNVLISDDGWDGIVINLETGFNELSFEDDIVTAGAGVKMATFVDFAIRQGRKGVEMLAGIPATLGGAVWMNAGCYGGESSDTLLDVTLIRDNKQITLTKSECGFRYRHSGFEQGDVLIRARFKMPGGDSVELREIKLGHLKHRNDVQPVNLPNCGSVFKNPKPEFSAQLIEAAGLKGTQIGDAQISPMHANFIVNQGGAKAGDVIALMNLARKKVYEMKGIILEPEVQLIGFRENPILPLM
ncbi:MAG: UDP-N-acetylmuramate dehydrogenase [bacterium]